jgi:hypothetical protein
MEQWGSESDFFKVTGSRVKRGFGGEVLLVFPVSGKRMDGRMEVVVGDRRSKSPPFASRWDRVPGKLGRALWRLRGIWREIKRARLPIFKLRLQRWKNPRWIRSVAQYVLTQFIPREDPKPASLRLAPNASKVN